MICPTCGSPECIVPAEAVLEEIYRFYQACSACPAEPNLSKDIFINEIFDRDTLRCLGCGKRPLDAVMAHILGLVGEELSIRSLKEVGTPLLAFGYPIPYPPRLSEKSLILVMDSIDKSSADRILSQVPEIRGIIQRHGLSSESVGILDTNISPHIYSLLGGCDMRCDVISSFFGEICIYKNQSKIHIEFPRRNSAKIGILEGLYNKGLLTGATLVDGFCGPGTLGLLSALGGAKKVILNDAWLPAIENVVLNMEVNREILGIGVEKIVELEGLGLVGREPVLVARGSGALDIEVYHGDFRMLKKAVKGCDLLLIDTFPGIDPTNHARAWRDTAKRVVII